MKYYEINMKFLVCAVRWQWLFEQKCDIMIHAVASI